MSSTRSAASSASPIAWTSPISAKTGLTVVLRFGAADCIIAWVDLPGIARYQMEFAFYAPDRRLTLSFPSPFLRSMPTLLKVEGGDPSSPQAWSNEQVVSYAESFKEELIHFHDCITSGRPPRHLGRGRAARHRALRRPSSTPILPAGRCRIRPMPRPRVPALWDRPERWRSSAWASWGQGAWGRPICARLPQRRPSGRRCCRSCGNGTGERRVAPAGHAQRPRRDAACRWSGRVLVAASSDTHLDCIAELADAGDARIGARSPAA